MKVHGKVNGLFLSSSSAFFPKSLSGLITSSIIQHFVAFAVVCEQWFASIHFPAALSLMLLSRNHRVAHTSLSHAIRRCLLLLAAALRSAYDLCRMMRLKFLGYKQFDTATGKWKTNLGHGSGVNDAFHTLHARIKNALERYLYKSRQSEAPSFTKTP